jgi:hypothetical protein
MSIDLAEHPAKWLDGIFTIVVVRALGRLQTGKQSSIQMRILDIQRALPEIGLVRCWFWF